MARAVHFDVMAKDIDRTIKFYKNALDWEIKKWESPDAGEMEYYLVMTGKPMMPPPDDRNVYGIDGGISVPPPDVPATGGYMVTMEVEDLEETAKKIEENGGKLVSERMDIPGVGSMYTAEDTEGNRFGVMQPDENAQM